MALTPYPANYNEKWGAMFDDVLEEFRMTIVLAPSEEVAAVFARLRGLKPERWKYVNDLESYRKALSVPLTMQYPYEVIRIEGWERGASAELVGEVDTALEQLVLEIKEAHRQVMAEYLGAVERKITNLDSFIAANA